MKTSTPLNLNYIGGEWVAGADEIESANPSDTSDIVGRFAQADARQTAAAIAAARAAQPAWARAGIEARGAALDSIGRELQSRAEELGAALSREEGKPLAEGKGEVFRAGQFFCYFAAEALRLFGGSIDSVRAGVEIEVRREPLGVVAVVSPWNFPVATASWKIAPALAFGNAVVWKPSNLTPAIAVELAKIIAARDLPPGAFNLLLGAGAVAGEALIGGAIDAVTFTGSAATGAQLAQKAFARGIGLPRLQMEMGAKNPLVVMDDADLDAAVAAAVSGAFGGGGQKCTASSRLVLHEKIHDAFIEKAVAATRALRVGHALEPQTQIGPLASQAQLDSALSYLRLAADEGAEKLCGGEQPQTSTPGYYLTPALFVGGDNAMRINREEMFAPIACVIKATDYDHALAIANDSDYGLVAGICTASLARAAHFRRHARAGCVVINLPTAGTDYHVPFGGLRASSYGPREQGPAAADFYTAMKTCYSAPGAPSP